MPTTTPTTTPITVAELVPGRRLGLGLTLTLGLELGLKVGIGHGIGSGGAGRGGVGVGLRVKPVAERSDVVDVGGSRTRRFLAEDGRLVGEVVRSATSSRRDRPQPVRRGSP